MASDFKSTVGVLRNCKAAVTSVVDTQVTVFCHQRKEDTYFTKWTTVCFKQVHITSKALQSLVCHISNVTIVSLWMPYSWKDMVHHKQQPRPSLTNCTSVNTQTTGGHASFVPNLCKLGVHHLWSSHTGCLAYLAFINQCLASTHWLIRGPRLCFYHLQGLHAWKGGIWGLQSSTSCKDHGTGLGQTGVHVHLRPKEEKWVNAKW